MSPVLIHLYNGWAIQAYGVCIAIGALLATYLAVKQAQASKLLTKEQVYNLFSWSVVVGTIGGWLLSVITLRPPVEELFSAGFSVLGSIISLVLFLAFYFRTHNIPVLKGLDFCAPYAPLVQAFGRIGCFFAGCCYGLPTNISWAVVYTDADAHAPLGIALHPAQLYSAGLLFLIFIIVRYWSWRPHTQGTIITRYLLLAGIERFITDFFREDHGSGWVSTHQLIALSMSGLALVVMGVLRNKKP